VVIGTVRPRWKDATKGRPEDIKRNAAIGRLRASKQLWGTIQSYSRVTITKIANAKAKASHMRGERLPCALAAGLFQLF
jgi:hypothetical protein